MKLSIPILSTGLIAGLASVAFSATLPYTDWQNDYTGDEANTVALWKFDTAGVGVGGNSYTGETYDHTAMGFRGDNQQTGASGKFGEAFYSTSTGANGDSSSAYLASPANGDPQTLFNGAAMSIELWFKPTTATLELDALGYLWDSMYTSSAGSRLVLGKTGNLVFTIGNGVVVGGISADSAAIGALSWTADQWYHIAVTFENVDNDGILKIYRDGVLVGQAEAADFGDANAGTQRLSIGARRASAYSGLPGYYDNFRISSVAYTYAIPEPGTVALLAPLAFVGLWQLKRKL